jgi:non-heme chloroperoxidase
MPPPPVPPLTDSEILEIERANASGRQPVLFVHGLWLLASSWDPWRELFESEGYTTLAPGWPDDPDTVEVGRTEPGRFAGKSVGGIANHFTLAVERLDRTPAIVGHSFGGLLTQMLAGRGLATASVAIDPAPFRGVLPLPRSALKAAWPVIGRPSNLHASVMLTEAQFRFAFTNALDAPEATRLYETFAVPGSAVPLFQAATANLNPKTELRVDCTAAKRGPMKILSGERDHTVPWSLANAAYKKQRRNTAVTEVQELAGRGHSLVIDSGWPEVAHVALDFLRRHAA